MDWETTFVEKSGEKVQVIFEMKLFVCYYINVANFLERGEGEKASL